MRIAIASLILTLPGCVTAPSSVDLDPYENAIIMELVGQPDAPITPVSTKHAREDCPGGGWVGDGVVRTRCLDCEPAWPEEEQSTEKPTVIEKDEAEKTQPPFGDDSESSADHDENRVQVAPRRRFRLFRRRR